MTHPDSDNDFLPYVRVRITEVQAYVSNVKTSTGKLHVMVSGGGESVIDQDLNRKEMRFTTITHFYPFTFRTDDLTIAGGNHLTGDDLKTYNLLTPFTTWNIRLPKRAVENQGIRNTSPFVKVTLKFRIYAIRKDPIIQ